MSLDIGIIENDFLLVMDDMIRYIKILLELLFNFNILQVEILKENYIILIFKIFDE